MTQRMVMMAAIVAVMFAFRPAPAVAGDWVGSPAPEIKLKNQEGDLVDVASYRGKWVALYFYPKDGTPGCTEEAKQFGEFHDRLKAKGVEIVGISVDDVISHRNFAERLKIRFNLLSDPEGIVAKQFGVLHGIGPVKFAGRETFLIDPEGTVVYHYAEVNSRDHAAQILHDVDRLAAANRKGGGKDARAEGGAHAEGKKTR